MKLAVPHWLIIIVTIIGTVAPQVGVGFPKMAAICAVIVQLVPIILGVLGAMSGSVLVKDTQTGVRGEIHPSLAPPPMDPPAPIPPAIPRGE